ncbi:site-specific tyrosine recombinase XerD [Propioniciclava soli]|uniref:Tyrosine recombinase XerC n=1 Tax=Propioniciclava soli TaxID=2775081 RepID=A0ABZ3CCP3_9ACTN|nr:site-specific tyrosine recombinase XerD [Propioniciclava soli]
MTAEVGASEHTVAGYRRDLARYAEHLAALGVTEPAQVTPEHVSAFAAALSAGSPATGEGPGRRPLAASSVARALAAVRSFHAFCARDGETPDNVAARVAPPRQGQRLPKALPLDAVEALLAAPDRTTPIGLRDAALLELLYGTGARVSEVVGLDVDDVTAQLDDPDLGLRLFGKGRKERVVPLGTYARTAVGDWLVRGRPGLIAKATRPGPALLLNTRGDRLSRQSAFAVLRTHAERARLGVEISPHTLRHSFATHLLDGGADVRVVQELLGHASVTTTQIYTLVTAEHLREVFAAAHPRAR